MMKKTVILVWTQTCYNMPRTQFGNYWGLGDLIRGAIKLFQLSKIMNFNLVINIDLHPISLYLKKQTSEYDELIMNNKNNIEFIGNVENYIKNSQKDVIYFLTTEFCDLNNITDECRDFIKTILSPSDELLNLLNNYKLKDYNIIHMRFGDEYIINKNIINNELIQSIKNKITNMLDDKNNIFMCDSYFIKNQLKNDKNFENKKVSFIDIEGGHIGYEQNREKIKNTLIEFFIISKSQKIKTYSVYSWNSGFTFWSSILYDIPIITFK